MSLNEAPLRHTPEQVITACRQVYRELPKPDVVCQRGVRDTQTALFLLCLTTVLWLCKT